MQRLNMPGNSRGNISVFYLILVLAFSVIFISCLDMCRIFIAREETKNAADAVSLSVGQNMLFFEEEELLLAAQNIAEKNGCVITELETGYDRVYIAVSKKTDFVFLKPLFPEGCIVSSVSAAKVTFPWDSHFGYCKSYRFSFR